MTAFARRRRARFERRRLTEEDPDNVSRRRDCAAQMQVFDQLGEKARARIRERTDDTDTVQLVRQIEQRGPSDRARAIVKASGRMPCDVPRDEWIALELEAI